MTRRHTVVYMRIIFLVLISRLISDDAFQRRQEPVEAPLAGAHIGARAFRRVTDGDELPLQARP